MSGATTFSGLLLKASIQPVVLAELEPSQQLEDWTDNSDDTYLQDIGNVDVQSVVADSTTLTEVTSLSDLGGADEWFYDGANLYVTFSDTSTPYAKIIVANYKMYFSNHAKDLNSVFYEPLLVGAPTVTQQRTELFWGITITGSGSIELINGNGRFDDIFESYVWNNKTVTLLIGGDDLPYSEYKKRFAGIISGKNYTTGRILFEVEDKKTLLEENIPVNTFDKTAFPNLLDDNVGKPIPRVWGTVLRQPVICLNEGQAHTSTYTFKVADTSTHGISAVDAAYVNGVSVTLGTIDIAAATFQLASTAYSAGQAVTADVDGYISGTLIENPVTITQELLELYGFADADWDLAARAIARPLGADFPCGLVVDSFIKGNVVIGDLMGSCIGTFLLDNNGLYSIVIWDTILDTASGSFTYADTLRGSLNASSRAENIRKVARCGWKRRWATGTYAYKQVTSAKTEKVYGITRSRSVETLLSTEAGAVIWASRIGLLYEEAIIHIPFSSKLQLSEKNVSDRFQISFKRREQDTNFAWLNERYVELVSITMDLLAAQTDAVVFDMRGIGLSAGKWTDDTLQFPDGLGGDTATAWDSSWDQDHKNFALANWGFWTDDDGLIDPAGGETLNKSRWW